MIQFINARIEAVSEQKVTVLIGAFGVIFFVPDSSLFKIGTEQKLYIYMHWNQEQGPSFYAFLNESDKNIFMLIIGCSGIGPKMGLAILADLGTQMFIQAISSQDIKALSKVSGIGAKKAEQLIVQLKHKLATFDLHISIQDQASFIEWQTLSQTLESLNYSRQEIVQAVNYLRTKEGHESFVFDQLMRYALSFLSKRL